MTPGPNGEPLHANNPTQWASSSPHMLKRLSKRCTGRHQHQQLVGGRAKDAQLYPLPLIVEILRGMRDHADAHFNHDDAEDIAMKVAATLNSTFVHAVPSHQKAYEKEALISRIASRQCKARV